MYKSDKTSHVQECLSVYSALAAAEACAEGMKVPSGQYCP